MSTNHCSPTEKDPHFYSRRQSIFRSPFFIAIFTSCVFFLSFFLVLSDLFDVVWFDPKARRFRCGQGALLSTMNQSTELSLRVMRIKSALSQKKVLLAALRPVNQENPLLVKLHRGERGAVISRSASLDLSADARARQSSPSFTEPVLLKQIPALPT